MTNGNDLKLSACCRVAFWRGPGALLKPHPVCLPETQLFPNLPEDSGSEALPVPSCSPLVPPARAATSGLPTRASGHWHSVCWPHSSCPAPLPQWQGPPVSPKWLHPTGSPQLDDRERGRPALLLCSGQLPALQARPLAFLQMECALPTPTSLLSPPGNLRVLMPRPGESTSGAFHPKGFLQVIGTCSPHIRSQGKVLAEDDVLSERKTGMVPSSRQTH